MKPTVSTVVWPIIYCAPTTAFILGAVSILKLANNPEEFPEQPSPAIQVALATALFTVCFIYFLGRSIKAHARLPVVLDDQGIRARRHAISWNEVVKVENHKAGYEISDKDRSVVISIGFYNEQNAIANLIVDNVPKSVVIPEALYWLSKQADK